MVAVVGSPLDIELAAIAAQNAVTNSFPVYTTGAPGVVVANKPISATAQTFVGQATAAAMLSSIGAAPLASPAFTGVPTAPTPADNLVPDRLATTSYVTSAIVGGIGGVYLPLTGGTISGPLTVNGSVFSIDCAGQAKAATENIYVGNSQMGQIAFYTGIDVPSSQPRWAIRKNATPESTGDVGSDFELRAYRDDGSFRGTAILIPRSSLVATLFAPPILTTPPLGTANNGEVPTTQWVRNITSLLAPIASPVFTGTPTAPTPAASDSSLKLATTAFVNLKTGSGTTITPLMFAAVGNGVVNDAVALQSTINACTVGGIIDGLGKTYKCNAQLVFKANMTFQNITIDGSGIGPDGSANPATGVLFTVTGSEAAPVAITGGATAGSEALTLTTTTFAANDWILVRSSDEWDEEDHCPFSEIHQIKSKTGTAITLFSALKYSMPVSPVAIKLTTINDLRLLNVKAFGNNTPVGTVGTRSGQWGAYFKYCKDLVIKDCDIQLFADRGIALYRCINPVITENTIGQCLSDFAYGVQLQAATLGARVTDNLFVNCIHGVDFGDNEGVNRGSIISDNTFIQMRSGGIDAHPATDDTLIDANIIDCNPNQAAGSAAIYYKGANGTITNNRVTSPGNNGIQVIDKTTGNTSSKLVIDGNAVRNVSGTYCLMVQKLGPNASTYPGGAQVLESIIITNNDLRHKNGAAGSVGILVSANHASIDEAIILGNKVRGPETGIYLKTNTGAGTPIPDPAIAGFTVDSNMVRVTNTPAAVGIKLNATVDGKISSGTINSNTVKGTPPVGIQCVNEEHLIITGNNLHGCPIPVQVTAANVILSNNLGT